MSITADPPPIIESIVSFTINRNDWFGLLGDVLPFAGNDDIMPVLTVVQVEIAGKRITVRATDRFTLGRAWYEVEDEIGSVTALIPVHEIRSAMKLHAANRRGLPQKELSIKLRVVESEALETNHSVDTGTITIESGGVFDARVTSEHKLYSGPFVAGLDKLIPEEFELPGAEVHWMPELVDKFRHVRRDRGKPLRVRFSGENRPIRFDIGDQFVGIAMPARGPGKR